MAVTTTTATAAAPPPAVRPTVSSTSATQRRERDHGAANATRSGPDVQHRGGSATERRASATGAASHCKRRECDLRGRDGRSRSRAARARRIDLVGTWAKWICAGIASDGYAYHHVHTHVHIREMIKEDLTETPGKASFMWTCQTTI